MERPRRWLRAFSRYSAFYSKNLWFKAARDQIFFLASGITFNVLVTIVPLLLITLLVALGLAMSLFGWFGGIEPIPFDPELAKDVQVAGGALGLFLILKGFSSGAVALTGVEAISNGVPAFRRPESKNAATTLVWMAVILGSLFFGVRDKVKTPASR